MNPRKISRVQISHFTNNLDLLDKNYLVDKVFIVFIKCNEIDCSKPKECDVCDINVNTPFSILDINEVSFDKFHKYPRTKIKSLSLLNKREYGFGIQELHFYEKGDMTDEQIIEFVKNKYGSSNGSERTDHIGQN